MSGPCLEDTPTIELALDGLSLIANVRNPDESFSATQGDHTLHDVTDHNVVHTQTQTVNLTNGGTAPFRGIVVCGQDPIYVDSGSDIEIIWHSSLTIDSVLADEGNSSGQAIVITGATGALWIPTKTLVGQIDVAAGDTIAITFEKSVENVGSSVQWFFLMGGDKLVANLGF